MLFVCDDKVSQFIITIHEVEKKKGWGARGAQTLKLFPKSDRFKVSRMK